MSFYDDVLLVQQYISLLLYSETDLPKTLHILFATGINDIPQISLLTILSKFVLILSPNLKPIYLWIVWPKYEHGLLFLPL